VLRITGAFRLILLLVLAVLALSGPLWAQSAFPTVFPKPLLVLDQDRFFSESGLGKAMTGNLLAKREEVIKNARGVYLAFETEERRLTDQRLGMDPAKFQILADDFDARVQESRKQQLATDLDLQKEADGIRQQFFRIAAPYMSQLLQKYSAGAILDMRSVLLFDQNMNITDEAIALLDKAFADNPNLALEGQTQ